MNKTYKKITAGVFLALFLFSLGYYLFHLNIDKEMSDECKTYYSEKENSITYSDGTYIYITDMNIELEEKCQLEK